MTLPMPPQPPKFATLALSRPDEHVLLITLDRPQSRNAFNTQMGLDLMSVLERMQITTDGVRCIVLTGSGDKAFSAGGDLKERRGMPDDAWQTQHAIFERMIRALVGCPIPVIAAVNGAAFGGGCEVASACDFIYASTNARFALTEVTLGIMPGSGGTQNVPRAMGSRRAKEILLTGQPFSAQQGMLWGLVNEIFEQEALVPAAIATAKRIAGNAPISVRQIKQSVNRGLDMSLADGLAYEIEAYNRTVPSEDRREGVDAFNEKRKPQFKGR